MFNIRDGYSDLPVTIPCGQCIGCKLEHSRQWAIRCSHEASIYKNNSFITLTYNDQNLPANGSLNPRHFTLFIKKLRKKYSPKTIRYYHCGEYGEKYGRPHYHACLFNHAFTDQRLFKENKNGRLYTSKTLTKLWGLGHASVGSVTFQSAAYVARYILKKITGDQAERHYEYIDPESGEVHIRKPEYTTMSRRPGIGAAWLAKYSSDVYPDDFVVINGSKMRPPKYYDKQYEIEFPSDFRRLSWQRKVSLRTHAANNTPDRLAVREKVQEARLQYLPRNLDEKCS